MANPRKSAMEDRKWRLTTLFDRLLPALLSVTCWLVACGAPEPAQEEAVAPVTAAPIGAAWFEEMPATGVDFEHVSGLGGSYFFPEHIGSGMALFDYDGDGDLDLYLVQSGLPPAEDGGEANYSNRLFRQESDGTFVDRTEAAGLLEARYGMGVAVGDYDTDGDLDLFVTNYGADALYRNEGDGSFLEVTEEAGVGSELWSTSACFLDADADADLDLFVITYVDHQPVDKVCSDRAGRPEFCGPAAFRAVPDLFYRNNGDGTFTDASDRVGIAQLDNRGLGIACLDFDEDGRQDVLVANDGEANQLWINQGERFEEQGVILGVATNFLGKPEASMGVAVGDVDGDLDVDFFLTHLDRETNTLYLNLGGGSGFEDATGRFNLGPESLALTGFGTGFFDADHDGDLDLLVANGRVRRGEPLIEPEAFAKATGSAAFWHDYAEPNHLFINESEAQSFRLGVEEAGLLGQRIEVGRAVVFGDLDKDGDLDVVLANGNGPARLYRNLRGQDASWLRINLPGDGSALGARVRVEMGEHKQAQSLTTTYSYLVGGPPEVHFGLGDGKGLEEVDVSIRWPDGEEQTWLDLPADHVLVVRRGDA